MGKARCWLVIAALGFILMAGSIAMAFLADHHWYITYRIAAVFESTLWWVQLVGILFWVLGCIFLVGRTTGELSLALGVGLDAFAICVVELLGGVAVMNIHRWTVAVVFPAALVLLSGTMFAVIGIYKVAILSRRN